MSSKISDMPVVATPIGTEFLPAITALNENVKIPISVLLPQSYPNELTVSLILEMNLMNSSSNFTGVELGTSSIGAWDDYSGTVELSSFGTYEVKFITKIECFEIDSNDGTLSHKNWPNINMYAGIGMEHSSIPSANLSMQNVSNSLPVLNSPAHFQWTDIFMVNSYEDFGTNYNSLTPYIRLHVPDVVPDWTKLRVKSILSIKRTGIIEIAV